jgi:hypothetical protein
VRNAYKIFVDKTEEKRPLGRTKRRWEDDIKTELKETGYKSVDWIHLAQGRVKWRVLVNTIMNLRVP